MVSGKSFSFAFCVNPYEMNSIVGATKIAQLTFFKQSKKNGYEEMIMEQMKTGDFQSYF